MSIKKESGYDVKEKIYSIPEEWLYDEDWLNKVSIKVAEDQRILEKK